MFCGKCGTKNVGASDYCTNCGSKINTSSTMSSQSIQNTAGLSAPSEQKKNRTIGITVVGVVVVVIVILGVYLFGGRQSDETVIDEYITAQIEGNAEPMLKLIPDEMVELMLEEMEMDYEEVVAEIDESLQESLDELEEYFGSDYSLSYEIIMEEEMSRREIADLVEEYEEEGIELDIEEAKVVEVELTYTATAGNTHIDSDIEIPLIKIEGSWYLDVLNISLV